MANQIASHSVELIESLAKEIAGWAESIFFPISRNYIRIAVRYFAVLTSIIACKAQLVEFCALFNNN